MDEIPDGLPRIESILAHRAPTETRSEVGRYFVPKKVKSREGAVTSGVELGRFCEETMPRHADIYISGAVAKENSAGEPALRIALAPARRFDGERLA